MQDKNVIAQKFVKDLQKFLLKWSRDFDIDSSPNGDKAFIKADGNKMHVYLPSIHTRGNVLLREQVALHVTFINKSKAEWELLSSEKD